MYSKVGGEPKDEVATIEREFLGSLITVPLHLTSAVYNFNLTLNRFKVCLKFVL